MGFYQQPNEWTCGPFSLKHALIALGKFANETTVANLAKTHWWSGTTEIGLSKAARKFGVTLKVQRSHSPNSARRALVACLQDRIPVILCVDDWEHWISVLRYQQGEFVIVDSNLDPVLSIVNWKQLAKRWCYWDREYSEESPPTIFDLMPLVPVTKVAMRGDFSPTRVKYLNRKANRGLATHWDSYVNDLSTICRPKKAGMTQTISMAEFLRRNRHYISTQVSYWHGDISSKDIDGLLEHFQFVAETYGLVIHSNDKKRALVDFTILASFWVTSRNPVAPFY